jgi:DNA repair and recombination RAD54-like protein
MVCFRFSLIPNFWISFLGSTDIDTRTNYISKFNDTANIRSRLFIVSTMAGGVGVNLVGSNRVVIFDCSWNPCK